MEDVISMDELIYMEEINKGSMEDEFDPNMEVWFDSDYEEDIIHLETPQQPEIINAHPRNRNSSRGVKKIELRDDQRKHMIDKLLLLADSYKMLPHGAQIQIAKEFKVCRTIVYRYWTREKQHMDANTIINVNGRKPGKVGRKTKKWDLARLNAIPVEKRTTIKAIAHALDISPSTVYRLIKTGKLRAHSNSLKPTIKEHHKISRVQHVFNHIIPPTVHTLPKFSGMYNLIHMDEKWFYMSQINQRFYLFPWEDEPYRACQCKNYIPKDMFEGVVGRPILGQNGDIIWDAKIGMFPFTSIVEAKKNSKNRVAGTPEFKATQSITQEVIRKKLIEEVIPATKSKWPTNICKDIWLQQDNARPHLNVNDHEFIAAPTSDGFNIRLVCQPAQSSDLNILDLGFFRAIQSLQYKAFPKDVTELVQSIRDAFDAYDPRLMNFTWLHLQYCMLEIFKVHGSNAYKNPHNKKHQMDRQGVLPTQIDVPQELIDTDMEWLASTELPRNEGDDY